MKRISLSLLAGVILLVLVVGLWPAPTKIAHPYFDKLADGEIEILAHGGGLGHAPPNTLYALARAHDMGADVLEVDVQQTKDGVLILRHDDALDRTTNMSGQIADKSWAEIQPADAGARTVIGDTNFAGTGIRVPTLAEAFAAFPDARWVVEIKNDTATAAQAMCDAIQSNGVAERVLVGSFHDGAMRNFRDACPDVATSMSSAEVRNFVIAARLGISRLIASPAVAMQIPVEGGGMDLTHPRVLAAAQARGIRIQYWTINDPTEMQRLLSVGADGLITDYVDRGRAAVASHVARDE